MKKFKDMKLLSGQHETISMMELRQCPGEVIDQILQGKRFTITRGDKIVADMHEHEPTALELGSAIRKLGLQEIKYTQP